MNEELLYFIWQHRRFDAARLTTTGGEAISVIHPGTRNFDAGPDFLNARLRIGHTIWAGNVEIHVKSSDFFKHGHQNDPAYAQLALHVVYQHDVDAHWDFPVLELMNFTDPNLEKVYSDMKQSLSDIACSPFLPDLEKEPASLWLERLAVQRLEKKCEHIREKYLESLGNWEECFYRFLAGSFGFSTNKLPFEMTAASLPLMTISRHKNQAEEVEALLFGQAGFLNEKPKDGYQQGLAETYRFFKRKYQLEPVSLHLWKFLRLRPANFPCLRISQFSNLVHNASHLLSAFIDASSAAEMKHMLKCQGNPYWKDHSRFGQLGGVPSLALGEESRNLLLINTVAPFLFFYGKTRHIPHLEEKALNLLSELAPENNKITRKYQALGLQADTAAQSQGMLELYKSYCTGKACLRCSIGCSILRPQGQEA